MRKRGLTGSNKVTRPLRSSKRTKVIKDMSTSKDIGNSNCEAASNEALCVRPPTSLMSLPAEMITYIMSFLSLDELEVTLAVSNGLGVVVKHTVLEDLLCARCKALMDQNHAILSCMINAQNQHIAVLRKLVAYYQGQLVVSTQEVNELRSKQTSLFEKEKEYCTQREKLQRELNAFTKKFGKYVMLKKLFRLLNKKSR